MMRKSQAWQSARTKRKNPSVLDLVTQTEATLASQSSEWTMSQSRGGRTRTATTLREADDFDDVIMEELDSLFIAPEEEEVIRQILQLARKGKINAGNAFQLPVKVINPYAAENSSMRFWKFASQLLHASMNVYDKRVENVFLSSNKMVDNLQRAGRADEDELEQVSQSRSYRKKRELLYVDIDMLCQSKQIAFYQMEQLHTEDPWKISLKQKRFLFLSDPCFHQKSQAFDSSSLGGLFLNAFGLSSKLEVRFFGQFEQNDSSSFEEESIDLCQSGGSRTFSEIVSEKQIKKLGFICSSQCLFSGITRFREEQVEGLEQKGLDTNKSLEGLYQEVKEMLSPESSLSGQATEVKFVGDCIVNFSGELQCANSVTISKNPFFYSADQAIGDHQISVASNQLPLSQTTLNRNLLQKNQCFTVMTPWQLECRGLKLRKKDVNGTKSRSLRSKKVENSFQCDFGLEGEDREEIFKAKECSKLNLESKSFIQRYILPKTMNPFVDIIKKKKDRCVNKTTATTILQNQRCSSFDQIQTKLEKPFQFGDKTAIALPDASSCCALEGQQMSPYYAEMDQESTESINCCESNVSSQCLQNLKTFGLRNIREVKSRIYELLLKKNSLLMSELMVPISPAGMLIIFLHLVNEKDLGITSIEDGTNVEIFLKN